MTFYNSSAIQSKAREASALSHDAVIFQDHFTHLGCTKGVDSLYNLAFLFDLQCTVLGCHCAVSGRVNGLATGMILIEDIEYRRVEKCSSVRNIDES